jgi:hypothetical protein
MKRTTKYVALDVHQATTMSSVRDAKGRVIARGVLPTEASELVEYFCGMRGAIHVAFEEGIQAWPHDLLAPVVDRVIEPRTLAVRRKASRLRRTRRCREVVSFQRLECSRIHTQKRD